MRRKERKRGEGVMKEWMGKGRSRGEMEKEGDEER